MNERNANDNATAMLLRNSANIMTSKEKLQTHWTATLSHWHGLVSRIQHNEVDCLI